MQTKNIYLNLFANIISFIFSTLISFLLTSFIVNNVSAEAYGMVNLANSLINYISIISISLNSMAIRYVSIHFYRNNIPEANKYFSSIIVSNIILLALSLFVFFPFIVKLEYFINISEGLIIDVKLLFILVLINFLVNLFVSAYSISIYIVNKLYLNSFRQVQSILLKGFLLIILFSFFKTRIVYIGIATCIASIFNLMWNIKYTKLLTPDLYFDKKLFKLKYSIKLLKSGVWNSVSKLGNVIDDSISLLMCNILLGEYVMGILSVAKTIPMLMFSILGTITVTFFPTLTNDYSLGNKSKLLYDLNQSIKTLGFLLNIPIVGFIVYSKDFFSLWTPDLSSYELSVISILSILPLCLTGATASIYDVFTITKKLKYNSITVLLNALINCVLIYFAIEVFDSGVISVVLIPCITAYLKNLIFTFPYVAMCLNVKWYYFYKVALKNVIVTFSGVLFLNTIKLMFFSTDDWISFIISVLLSVCLLMAFNFVFIFNKKEKRNIVKKIILKFKRIIQKK